MAQLASHALAPALAFAFALHASACSSRKTPNPDEIERTDVLARVAQLDRALEESENRRAALNARLHSLELAAAKAPPPSASDAQVAALESRIAALEEKNALLELKLQAVAQGREAPEPAPDSPVKIIDHRPPATREPAPGEVVTALVPIDGETFAYRQGQVVDRALLLGIEAPLRAQDYAQDPERRARAAAAWGEAAVSSDAAWERARDRLALLLDSGELSFAYSGPGDHREAHGRARLLVYARVKRPSGEAVSLNQALVEEGLALPRGAHEKATELEKAGEQARREKRGLYAGP